MGNMLRDRVAIITGAGRGLGRAHALAMAQQGAKVIVNDLGGHIDGAGASRAPADEVVSEIRQAGGVAIANYDSVASPEGAQSLIDAALEQFGRLDILVNNAGTIRDRSVLKMTDEEWDSVIKVHLYGTFYCLRDAARLMRDQGYGRIVNTSSAAGLGNHGQTNYSAAKEGIVGLTRTVAKELAKYGINVNCIRPRAATRLTLNDEARTLQRRTMTPNEVETWEQTFLETRPPSAVSALAVYLASEGARITGCVFECLANHVFLYADPPRIAGNLSNTESCWSPEQLADLLPKTLLSDYQFSPSLRFDLMPDARGWEWNGKELRKTQPALDELY